MYPLVDDLEAPVELAVPWPGATPERIVHGWIGDDPLRVAVGGADRATSMVVEENGPVAAAALTANGSTLVWLTPDGDDASGRSTTLGLARWGDAEELAAGNEPRIEQHPVDGLPGDLDLDRVLLELETAGGETTLKVLDGSTATVERAWELQLEHDGPDRRLPEDARFEPLGARGSQGVDVVEDQAGWGQRGAVTHAARRPHVQAAVAPARQPPA